jgi:hypothetical protein
MSVLGAVTVGIRKKRNLKGAKYVNIIFGKALMKSI